MILHMSLNAVWLVDFSFKSSFHSDRSRTYAVYNLHLSINRSNLMGRVLSYQVSISGLKVRLLVVVALKLGKEGYIG